LKDFFQYASPTRVIAGRALLESTGFEFKKEGARRVFVVTDPVVRGTGLVERLEAGVADGHFQARCRPGVARIGLPTRLPQVGVPEDGIPALVEGAMGDGTTLLNPGRWTRTTPRCTRPPSSERTAARDGPSPFRRACAGSCAAAAT
jgi:alcohol dehydrogenase class IV